MAGILVGLMTQGGVIEDGLDDQGSVVEDSGSLDAGEWKLKTKRRRKKRRVRRVFRRAGRLG